MLDGKVAVVTGGTRGIGLEVVKKFLENGAKVILCGSRQETVDKAVNSLKEVYLSGVYEGICPDLSNLNEVEEAFKKIYEKYGSIDIVVNNAGISASQGIADYTEEAFNKIMDLNVKAVFNFSKAAAVYMKEQKSGVIINTSSVVSLYGQQSGVGYPTSKFAVNGLTKSLARELGPYNIRVNAVAPGVTRTDMVAALPEAVVKAISSKIALNRVGEPEEVANAFLFLASDMASYVTGEILSVDGAYVN